MRLHLLATFVVFIFISCQSEPVADTRPPDSELIGFWCVPLEQLEDLIENAKRKNETNLLQVPPHPFYYDGDSIILELTPFKKWMKSSPDDIYRVKSRWEGNKLMWLPPMGEWEMLAFWKSDSFCIERNNHVWRFVKTPISPLDKNWLPFLKERPLHDYASMSDSRP